MSAKEIQFPRWMPSDAQDICIYILSAVRSVNFPQARDLLERLATRLEMEDAWRELKHFQNQSPGKLLYGAFLIWLCALGNQYRRKYPSYATSLRDHAVEARAVAKRLRALADRPNEGIDETMLKESDRVAAYFERQAENPDEMSKIGRPPRKAGARNALQIAFVNTMCDWLREPKGRRPYTLVAILANIVFDASDDELWDVDRVKKCYASRSRK